MFQFEDAALQEIRSSVRRLSEREIPKYQSDEHYNTIPRALFRACSELGLTGLDIPESLGGIEADAVTSMVVMEELAAVDLGPAIFISVHAMVSGLIARFGTPDQQQRFLPKMASGDYLGAFGLTEPAAGSNAAALRSTARRSGDTYILNGDKCYITSAGFADLYVVFARVGSGTGSEGITAFIVESGAPGLTIGKPEKKMGAELSPIATIQFTDLVVPEANRLGGEGEGYRVALSGLAGGRINIAACANGIARSALERALTHLKEREQFGQKLIEFQGLQFMLADMRLKLEAAQLITWQAARTLDTAPESRQNRITSSLAKCAATDAAMSITTDAVQLLGGAGYIREYAVERLMREAKMLQIVEGANQVQRMLIAREMAEGF